MKRKSLDHLLKDVKKSNYRRNRRIAAFAVVAALASGYWFYSAEVNSKLKASQQAVTQKIANFKNEEPAPGPIEKNVRHSDLNAQGRQIVFNDDNYRPKTNINTIEAVTPVERQPVKVRSQPVQAKKNAGNKPQTKSAYWEWETTRGVKGSGKKKVGGQFQYEVKNGLVLSHTVCKNETAGSFRYRDCRKGAKEYFKRACKQGNQEACTGENMAP